MSLNHCASSDVSNKLKVAWSVDVYIFYLSTLVESCAQAVESVLSCCASSLTS